MWKVLTWLGFAFVCVCCFFCIICVCVLHCAVFTKYFTVNTIWYLFTEYFLFIIAVWILLSPLHFLVHFEQNTETLSSKYYSMVCSYINSVSKERHYLREAAGKLTVYCTRFIFASLNVPLLYSVGLQLQEQLLSVLFTLTCGNWESGEFCPKNASLDLVVLRDTKSILNPDAPYLIPESLKLWKMNFWLVGRVESDTWYFLTDVS